MMDSENFYNDAAKYWEKIPATVDGMLGGFGFISNTDIKDSNVFLKSLFKLKSPPGKTRALDCGAGIGRITKNLLIKHFDKVDLVEQNPQFLTNAKSNLEQYSNKIGEYYPIGLQNFNPSNKYDVIWCQWVLGHLNDNDLVLFFKKCIESLRENGVIVVKDNMTLSEELEVDKTDSSVTRPYNEFIKIFNKAGLTTIKVKLQNKMPQGLFPVYMIALKPDLDAEKIEALNEPVHGVQ